MTALETVERLMPRCPLGERCGMRAGLAITDGLPYVRVTLQATRELPALLPLRAFKIA